MLVAVIVGFALALITTAYIIADITAGWPRRAPGRETTIGRIVRVRGPFRPDLNQPSDYIEITAEYFTRQGDGPFHAVRRLPALTGPLYVEDDRVAISYDGLDPRRGEILRKVPPPPNAPDPRRSARLRYQLEYDAPRRPRVKSAR